MYDDFVVTLPLSAQEKEVIYRLGAPNAAALLSMMRATPESFDALLGSERTRELQNVLEGSVSQAERDIVDAPLEPTFYTGALVDREPPSIPRPRFNVKERDYLFDQLQHLRSQEEHSASTKQHITEIEQKLNSMLEDHKPTKGEA
ncbi:MAG: hypothetical protein JNK74_06110 [Candidatus Hydrogenedentes bacterium]|nr:hypothetical protein [Candidatus Hydrogenedentota bacterium]